MSFRLQLLYAATLFGPCTGLEVDAGCSLTNEALAHLTVKPAIVTN